MQRNNIFWEQHLSASWRNPQTIFRKMTNFFLKHCVHNRSCLFPFFHFLSREAIEEYLNKEFCKKHQSCSPAHYLLTSLTARSLASQRNQTAPYHTSLLLQRAAWPRRALQSRHLSDNTNTMKNVVWGVATHSWGKAKLHISAAVARAEKSLCRSIAGATSGERSGCPTRQGYGGLCFCCCLQPTVCFQMLHALRQMSQPFQERKQGLCS